MSSIPHFNMQDGIVKSSLVQQVQFRQQALQRAAEGTLGALHDEAARQASETIREVPEAENQGIRDEGDEREEGEGRRRRRRRERGDEEEAENPPPRHASPPTIGPARRIDITA